MNILILDKTLKKIQYYTSISPVEISGIGYVEEFEDKLIIKDIFLVKQRNTAVTTELDQGEVALLMEKLLNEGKDPSKLKLWWHSHVNMLTFWSGTDEQCVKNLCLDQYLISIVTNKKGDYKMRFDIKEPYSLTLDDLNFNIIESIDQELYDECKIEVERVTK
jgi:hypothetical protein